MERHYVLSALGYGLLGLVLGLYMSTSGQHQQLVTHAHIMLVGFLLGFAYALLHRLWLEAPQPSWARLQFALHQLGAPLLFIGLFLLYGGWVPESLLGPVLGLASALIIAALGLMTWLFVRQPQAGTG